MQCKASVLQNSYGQLTGASRVNILASAIIYVNTTQQTAMIKKPVSSSNYLAFKKAQILANSSRNTGYPPQTAIITELQDYQEAVICPT